MQYKFRHLLTSVLLFIIVLSGTFMFAGGANEAWGQGCTITVAKEVFGNNEVFELTIDDGFSVFTSSFSEDFDFFYGWGPTADLTVTETVPPGWRLADIICFNDGVAITEIENGIIAKCIDPNNGFTECVFVNVDPAGIPTLSEWGMISAAAGLGLVGMFFVIRRKRLQASA